MFIFFLPMGKWAMTDFASFFDDNEKKLSFITFIFYPI